MNKQLKTNDLKSFTIIGTFFLFGILLMYFGYFKIASDKNIFLYSIALSSWMILYAVIFGFFLKPIYSLYSWFSFLLFFPKKPINSDYLNYIFGKLFSIDGSLIFSLYEVLEVGILLTLVIAIVKNTSKKIDAIEIALYLIIVFGVFHIVNQYENINNILTYQSLMPIIEGAVLYKAFYLIKSRKQLELIFSLFIVLALVLFAEYTLGRLNILPNSINYYIFNYRNAFRSTLVSSDLLIGLLLIVSSIISLYRYKISLNLKDKVFYISIFIISNYLIIETYNRTPFFALVIITILFAVYSKEFLNIILYVLLIAFVLFPISKYASSVKIPNYHKYAIEHHISIDEAARLFRVKASLSEVDLINHISKYATEHHISIDEAARLFYVQMSSIEVDSINHNFDRRGGYYSTHSIFDRIGALLRGLDALIYTNFLGSGPGELVKMMSSDKVPSYVGQFITKDEIKESYERIRLGKHVTNTHILYVNLLAEYGVIVLLFFIIFLYKVYSLLYRWVCNKENDNLLNISLLIVIAYIMYYCLQVSPNKIAIALFFFSIANNTLKSKEGVINNEKFFI